MDANSYWTDSRLAAQQSSARAVAIASPAREISREIVGTRTEVRRRGGIIPSWVAFTTIILATFALCLSVTMRTHAEMRAAEQRHEQINSEVQTLRDGNVSLERELQSLRTDPRAIERIARERLHMVRANEMIVPVE